MRRYALFCCLIAIVVLAGMTAAEDPDPFLWLEEIDGERALEWVTQQNERTTSALKAVVDHDTIYERILKILDSDERIPDPLFRGPYVYNLWQDSDHERGVWRRTSQTSYRTAEPEWETVLDLDALSKQENVAWTFAGADCLPPDSSYCIISLSRGGGDAVTLREYDTQSKSFVPGGFSTPEAKTFAAWKDSDTLWVATSFGEGSLTTSGYPRYVKEWRRGTPLEEARLVFEVSPDDVVGTPLSVHTPEGSYHFMVRVKSFVDTETFLVLGGRLVRLNTPNDARGYGVFRDHLILSLRSDWTVGDTTFPQGALLAVDIDGLLLGKPVPDLLFKPTETAFLQDVATTRDRVVMVTLENVRGRAYQLSLDNNAWTTEEIPLAGFGAVSVSAWPLSEAFVIDYEDFTTPRSLLIVENGKPEKVKELPALFDTAGVKVTQTFAVSADGTRIPYFLITPKGFKADGSTPTILTGYGGFEVNILPSYNGPRGASWIERGGALAVANLRGGGELGPAWHQAALRENRIKWFEDFIAVADDLVDNRVTSRSHLAIVGGSNGGLLVGGTFTIRPDICRAVVCQVPLLDMKRFHKLLAGASWISEYGNPDVPEDWAYMKDWSPYHNLRDNTKYPTVLFWTNHRDDRVHPGHARKMAAKMLSKGHDVYYFESLEGGHGSGAINRQRAELVALEYAFLWKTLK